MPVRRYWSGLGASVALTTPAFTTYMVAYRQSKRELAPYLGGDSLANYIVSGTNAELASSFIWTPMEVIKGRMQIATAGEGGKAPSTIGLVRRIYAAEGLRGFFRGYWLGIAVFVPHSVVWWSTYETSKTVLVRRNTKNGASAELTPGQIAAASVVGTVCAASAANFLDVVKTRQQLAVSDEIRHLRPDDAQGVLQVARNLIREAGVVRAMVKGLHIRLMHALPSGVLSMVIVETLNPDVSPESVMRQGLEEEEQVL